MTSRNFKKSMVNQDQEIIFEVVKVSGEWVFPAASSIVEATRGKNMYLRLTDDGRSDIFRLDSVKDGENAGETVFGFVGNGGMDIVELTATTDGTGATTGSWDYEPGEGPAGEAIGNLGQPLQWKGPATVAQLNAGITGIQEGWTYTLTDAGTLTDGSIAVEKDDEVAWTGTTWFKIGGNCGVKYVSMNDSYSDIQAIIDRGQFPIMKVVAGQGYLYYYPSFEYNQFVFNCVTDSGIYGLRWNGTAWAAQDKVIYGMGSNTKSEEEIDQGVLSIDGGNTVTKVTLATVNAVTFSVDESVPAFAIEIDNTGNSNDVDVTVVNGATTLKYSSAAGNQVGAGKYVQLTCVGSCWTLAEFEAPAP